jgi:hypothetical protein
MSRLPSAGLQESLKLGVDEVDMLLCCVEHGSAAIGKWGPAATDERYYANPVTNPAENLLIVSTRTLCSARGDA